MAGYQMPFGKVTTAPTPKERGPAKISSVDPSAPPPKTVFRPNPEEEARLSRQAILLQGLWGVGKTTAVCTMPKPLLIDMFDPSGLQVILQNFREEYDQGLIQVRLWYDDDTKEPYAYLNWEKQFAQDVAYGTFKNYASYCVDSFTTWYGAAARYWLWYKNQQRKSGEKMDHFAINDYNGLYTLIDDLIFKVARFDTHFIVTAHLQEVTSDKGGFIGYSLNAPGKKGQQLPSLFSEKLCMIRTKTPSGSEHMILTSDKGYYKASTQLGSHGRWEQQEKPNFRELFKKAGIPYQDKPLYWLEEEKEEEPNEVKATKETPKE